MVSECSGVSLVLAYDLTQSTGPATQQGSDGSMSTLHGTGIDSKSGKNEDAGSATGTKRDRSRSGAESGPSHGSARPNVPFAGAFATSPHGINGRANW